MRTIIISPSGRFYGSEQVLCDYLSASNLRFSVFVPSQGQLHKEVQKFNVRHRIVEYDSSNITFFYIKIFFLLLFKSYSKIYCNEGGHVRYLRLLARIFRKKKFYVHIRLLEDTHSDRWRGKKTQNLHVVVVSDYIRKKINFESELLYDPYNFKNNIKSKPIGEKLQVGIIGRISVNKGVNELIALVEFLEKFEKKYEFLLFGEIDNELVGDKRINKLRSSSNVHFKGFVKSKSEIYNSIDCVLHLCQTESLGRIFLEAIDFNIPLIGIQSGGIGEIGKMTGLTELLVGVEDKEISKAIFTRLVTVERDRTRLAEEIDLKKQGAKKIFSLTKYTNELDAIL